MIKQILGYVILGLIFIFSLLSGFYVYGIKVMLIFIGSAIGTGALGILSLWLIFPRDKKGKKNG